MFKIASRPYNCQFLPSSSVVATPHLWFSSDTFFFFFYKWNFFWQMKVGKIVVGEGVVKLYDSYIAHPITKIIDKIYVCNLEYGLELTIFYLMFCQKFFEVACFYYTIFSQNWFFILCVYVQIINDVLPLFINSVEIVLILVSARDP